MQTSYDKTKYSKSEFNYFDGSFYLGVKLASGSIKWHDSYNLAKQYVFNGMNGYLINITSEVENNYIFNRMGLGQCQTGGARLDENGCEHRVDAHAGSGYTNNAVFNRRVEFLVHN